MLGFGDLEKRGNSAQHKTESFWEKYEKTRGLGQASPAKEAGVGGMGR